MDDGAREQARPSAGWPGFPPHVERAHHSRSHVSEAKRRTRRRERESEANGGVAEATCIPADGADAGLVCLARSRSPHGSWAATRLVLRAARGGVAGPLSDVLVVSLPLLPRVPDRRRTCRESQTTLAEPLILGSLFFRRDQLHLESHDSAAIRLVSQSKETASGISKK